MDPSTPWGAVVGHAWAACDHVGIVGPWTREAACDGVVHTDLCAARHRVHLRSSAATAGTSDPSSQTLLTLIEGMVTEGSGSRKAA